jgi:hypothetical protein
MSSVVAAASAVQPSDPTEARRHRGLAIAAITRIVPKDGYWLVPSQTGSGSYRVHLDPPPSVPQCTCRDYETRGEPCKHVYAVRAALDPETCPEPLAVAPQAEAIRQQTRAPRPTYKQDWPAYDAAQINEKAKLQVLLRDLCGGIPNPPPNPKGGQRPIPMSDRAFACAFKVYTTISGRRASTDMRDAREKGHIDKAPHYSSVSRFLEDPAMTPVFRSLITESARPLASVESDFAADSSGFTTCRFESWYDHKYGIVRRQHEWVKVHIMTGTKTNVVTAAEIKGKLAQDSPILPALVEGTARNFAMREVSADAAYGSLDNYDAIAAVGATPYILFKSIHTGAGGGLWARMFHFYQFNRDDYLASYHKRSNVESTFSMVKAKFGDSVRSKSDTAMVNEVLCKILCHNICCIVQSLYEFGIAAKFWNDSCPEPLSSEPADPTADESDKWAWV